MVQRWRRLLGRLLRPLLPMLASRLTCNPAVRLPVGVLALMSLFPCCGLSCFWLFPWYSAFSLAGGVTAGGVGPSSGEGLAVVVPAAQAGAAVVDLGVGVASADLAGAAPVAGVLVAVGNPTPLTAVGHGT